MKKKTPIIIIAALVLAAVTMTGCGNKNENGKSTTVQEEILDTATKEIRQNDYRGGIMRTYALQDSILKVMEDMKQNNTVIRADSPNSFWTADGYQDFVVNFLSIAIIDDTQWCNEEETDWTTVVTQTGGVQNSFTVPDSDSATGFAPKYSSFAVIRNEKDDYSITGINGIWNNDSKYQGSTSYRILYDCDKDWCKAYAELSINNDLPAITTELFEYARIDSNTFAVQTSTERLVVILDTSEQDTDIRERKVKEFYYSKLTAEGARTTFEPYEPLPEYDEDTGGYLSQNALINERMETYSLMNEKGDLTLRYSVHDSVFLTDDILKNINPEWVYEDRSLQQAIVYSDGALVVTTYNKLSEMYERFIYTREGVSEEDIAELEDMVKTDSLVGIQEIPENVRQEKQEEPATEEITTTEAATTDIEISTAEETLTTTEITETQVTSETVEEETESPEDKQRRIAEERQNGDVYYE
ncbi:MAG: hypothetical protein NC489_15850 [Ruminococcus flavefaciens]|nr:hypothetical protein [Ruminococcus flavefaciens]